MGLTTSDTGSLKELRNDSHDTTFCFADYLVRRVELKREKDGDLRCSDLLLFSLLTSSWLHSMISRWLPAS